MNYWFSPANNAFYPVALKNDYLTAGTLPDDLIEVSNNVFIKYSGTPPDGKIRAAGSDGKPCWLYVPAPTQAEIEDAAEAKKNQLRTLADAEIVWRQDAVDSGIATDEEIAALAEWKKYRVLLMRVDTAKPDWPTPPVVPARQG